MNSQKTLSKHCLLYYLRCNHLNQRSFASYEPKKSHYDVLSVHPNATSKEIKNSFLDLSKRYHPDKNCGNAAMHEKFIELNEAYSIVGKESSRREYDRLHGGVFSVLRDLNNNREPVTNKIYHRVSSTKAYEKEFDRIMRANSKQRRFLWKKFRIRYPQDSYHRPAGGVVNEAFVIPLAVVGFFFAVGYSIRFFFDHKLSFQRIFSSKKDLPISNELDLLNKKKTESGS